MSPAVKPLVRAEQEDGRSSSFGADDFETAPDSGGPLTHAHEAVTRRPARRETATLVRDLDEERPRRETHLDAADRGSGVAPDIRQSLADDLGDHLTMVW